MTEGRDEVVYNEIIKRVSLLNREDLYFLYQALRNLKHLKAVYNMLK